MKNGTDNKYYANQRTTGGGDRPGPQPGGNSAQQSQKQKEPHNDWSMVDHGNRDGEWRDMEEET